MWLIAKRSSSAAAAMTSSAVAMVEVVGSASSSTSARLMQRLALEARRLCLRSSWLLCRGHVGWASFGMHLHHLRPRHRAIVVARQCGICSARGSVRIRASTATRRDQRHRRVSGAGFGHWCRCPTHTRKCTGVFGGRSRAGHPGGEPTTHFRAIFPRGAREAFEHARAWSGTRHLPIHRARTPRPHHGGRSCRWRHSFQGADPRERGSETDHSE